MHITFNEYNTTRAFQDSRKKIDIMCEALAVSGVSFDEFWKNIGLPVFLEGAYTNENELIELWGQRFVNVKNINECYGVYGEGMWDKVKGLFGGNQQTDPNSPIYNKPIQNGPLPTATPLVPKLPVAQPIFNKGMRDKIDASVNLIKKELGNTLNGIVDKMKTEKNATGYQIASILGKQIGGYVDNIKGRLRKGEGKFDAAKHFGDPNATPTGNGAGTQSASPPLPTAEPQSIPFSIPNAQAFSVNSGAAAMSKESKEQNGDMFLESLVKMSTKKNNFNIM